MIDKIRCRLFGIKLPEDAEQAAKAKRFLELYMQECGNYFSIYNTSNPISAEDGVPLIWLKGHGNSGWAQQTLLEADLVKLDFEKVKDYRFTVPAKSGDKDFNWKQCFDYAFAARRDGRKPTVFFEWPEAAKK
jgi:hypothetical protein